MRICFFGDSFVNGAGDPLYQGWVGRACARARSRGADITAYNCGIRGATSDDIKASWLSEAVISQSGVRYGYTHFVPVTIAVQSHHHPDAAQGDHHAHAQDGRHEHIRTLIWSPKP